MAQTITGSLNLSKIDKSKLIKGEKGVYLNIVIFVNDEVDQYNNNVAIAQSQSKEERENGNPTAYLGNGKTSDVNKSETKGQPAIDIADDDLPF